MGDDDDNDNNNNNESRGTHRNLMMYNNSTQIRENTHADRCGNTSWEKYHAKKKKQKRS